MLDKSFTFDYDGTTHCVFFAHIAYYTRTGSVLTLVMSDKMHYRFEVDADRIQGLVDQYSKQPPLKP